MSTTPLNLVLYQLGWFACVLGAAADRAGAGVALALGLVGVHVALAPARRREVALLGAVAAVGSAVETLNLALGCYRFAYEPVESVWPPPWIVVLWAQFATTFRFALSWLAPRPVLAVVLGALGGPAAFLAGRALGAVEFTAVVPVVLLTLSLEWGSLLPILLAAARDGRGGPPVYRGFTR